MRLFWLDLETTGLDPVTCNILELAMGVSAWDRPFEVEPIYSKVFPYCQDLVRWLEVPVRVMHEKNGLWKECDDAYQSAVGLRESRLVRGSCVMKESEKELLDLVENYRDEEQPVLVGSCVHFDRDFLWSWMPTLAGKFSHRHYDVSSIKLFCESLGMPKIPKGEAHRAMADVLESAQHAEKRSFWISAQNWTR